LPPDIPEQSISLLAPPGAVPNKGVFVQPLPSGHGLSAAMSLQAQLPWVWITTGAHTFQPLAVFEYLAYNVKVCLMLG